MKKTALHRPESTHDAAAGTSGGGGCTSSSSTSRMEGGAKRKTMEEEEQQPDAGVDELLAALGYKVRSSDMADVAQKLEQLEMAMSMGGGAAASTTGGGGGCGGSGSIAAEDHASVLTHLASETVHYNPSDLSTWLENMLSEFNIPLSPPLPPPVPSFALDHPLPRQQLHQRQTCDEPIGPAAKFSSISTANLLPRPPAVKSTIPCGYGPLPSEHLNKRIKATTSDSEETSSVRSRNNNVGGGVPVVLVDSQETGIRLVHTLVACAEAVQQGKLKAAEALVKQMGVLAMSQGGAMRKVATYFAEGLARRIYRIHPVVVDGENLSSEAHFYEACPYLKFGHFTANQAILEAFAGKSRVHVIDLGMKQGMQWPALMQALALRPEGPPSFRLTGIGPPQPDNTDALQQVGWWLAQLAETLHVQFEYRGLVANTLADLEPYMLTDNGVNSVEVDDVDGDCEEAVAINAVLELHGLLGRPGAIDKVLGTMKATRPSVVTVVEVEAEHNGPVFLDRFTEALHYYSSMFDSLEGGGGGSQQQQQQLQQIQVMAEVYLGRQICNVVACEGPERTERHERIEKWRRRMVGAGFEEGHLGSNAYKQANMLLELSAAGDGYRVEEREGCLMLAWHTRPLITTSAWTIASSNAPPPSTTRRSSLPFKFDDHT